MWVAIAKRVCGPNKYVGCLLVVVVRTDILTFSRRHCYPNIDCVSFVSNPVLYCFCPTLKLTRIRSRHLLCRFPAVRLPNGWNCHYSHWPQRANKQREEDYWVLVCRILLLCARRKGRGRLVRYVRGGGQAVEGWETYEVSVCAAERRKE